MLRLPSSLASTAVALALLAPVAAGAETTTPGSPGREVRPGPAGDHPHNEPAAGEIVVTAHLPSDFALLEGTTVLSGEELIREWKPQIGDMLASLPGVTSSAFAPGAARPIVRGFDAERVQVLIDGIGTIDASSVSADHAVSLDTLTVDHVDVVHGPAVLLFGGQAIGGAVNVLDRRIPRRVPERLAIAGIGAFGSAARERSIGGALDVPLTGRLVAHVDASYRRSGDVRVGGRIVSASLRDALLGEAEEAAAEGEASEAAELFAAGGRRGRVPNTQSEATNLGAGLAFIDGGGNLGLSVQRFETTYGIAARPGAGAHEGEEGDGHEDVAIDLAQTRFDLRGGVEIGGLFDRLLLRAAYGDYRHVELEGGEAGTRFARKGLEGRLELVQARRGPWHGHLGVQVAARSLEIDGNEASVPDNADTRLGVFTLQGFDVGPISLEAAGRFERVTIRSREIGLSRAFDLWSGALGGSFAPVGGLKIGASYLHGARAPSAEELLSEGLHIATQAFEIGNPAFDREQSSGVEVFVRYKGERAGLTVTGFHTDFDRFITPVRTGEEVEGFPVFRFVQLPARYQGIEAAGELTARRWSGGELRLEAGADYVRASLGNGNGPVPRIPPLRLRGAAEAEWRSLTLRGEVEWNARQQRVGSGEAAVPGFTLVGASAAWRPFGHDGPLTLIVAAENLFDVIGRRATSFTRDYLPIAGRDLRLTASLRF